LRNERSTNVRKRLYAVGLVTVIAVALGGIVTAQDKPPAQGAPRLGALVPLKVQLVISRYQGDKKISSVPYTMSVNATDVGSPPDMSRLRMGVQVAVPVMAPPTSDGKPVPGAVQAGPVQYKDLGTNIDCFANTLDGGRFKLSVTVEESSLYSSDAKSQGSQNTNPVFRQFRISNSLVLKDGQSEQFSTATDRISGEVVKLDVTLSVLK